MLKRACAVLILSGLVAAGTASAATSPEAQARALVTRCLTALRGLPVVKIASRSAAGSRSVRTRHVNDDCSLILPLQSLALAHPHDKALQDAYDAGVKLNISVGDYAQYVFGVASGRQKLALLRRSQREVAAAKHAAHVALGELG